MLLLRNHYEALRKISEWMISASQSSVGDNLFTNTFTQASSGICYKIIVDLVCSLTKEMSILYSAKIIGLSL